MLNVSQTQRDTVQSENVKLKEQLDVTEMSKLQLVEELEEARKQQSIFEEVAENAQLKFEKLQCNLDQMTLERDDLYHKIEILKNENERKLKSLKDEIGSIEDKANLDRATEVNKLQYDLDQVSAERDDLLKNLKDLEIEKTKENDHLEDEVQRFKNKLSGVQAEADQRVRSMEDLESMLESTNTKFQSHIDELQTEQKSRYEKEVEYMRAEFEATIQEKEILHDELKKN